MSVVWTNAATQDLHNIYKYISQDNPTAATQVVSGIISIGEDLATFSHRGRHGRVSDTYEMVLTRLPYTIAYRATVDQVEILRVLHHAQLWPDML